MNSEDPGSFFAGGRTGGERGCKDDCSWESWGGGEDALAASGLLCLTGALVLSGVDGGGLRGTELGTTGTLLTTTLDGPAAGVEGGGGFALTV